MNIFLNLNKKSVVLCTMLTYSLPSYLDAANGAFDPNRAIEVVAGLIGKNMDDRASSGAQSRDFNFGANPSSPGGLQLPSSLIPGGSQGAGVPGALPGMPGAPGMPGTPGTPGTGGSTIIQNFNINIGEQPPKGFSLATGSDGKPVEPKTVIGPDGKPITTVEAKDANGNPVVLEQTIGMDGKPVVTTILKDSNGQEIRTPVAPENLQPIEGIIDFTKIDIDDILTNPRRGENFKVYNKILSEAMKDPQTRDKLKIISDIESERAVLKFFAQSKKEKHMAEAQSLQKQMLEAKAKQDEQLRKEALERAKLAESEREEMERLSKENQALYIKVFGMTPSDQRGQLVENMASIAKEHNVGSDSVPTAPTQMPAVTTAPMPAGMPQMPVMPTNPQLNAAALPVVPTFAAPTLPQGLPQLPTARGATMSASPTPATTTPAAALPPGFKAPTFTMPTPPAFSAPNLPTFAPPQLPTNLPKL